MRILFLGEPASANTLTWINGLRDEGCDVDVASVRVDSDADAFPIGDPKLPPRIRVMFGVRDLKRIIADRRPDVLLAYRITSYGFLAARTGFQPLVLAAQNERITYMDRPSFWREKILTYCSKYAIRKARLIHAWGDNIRQGLLSFGADDDKIMVKHRGIDVDVFQPGAKSLADPGDSPVFVSTRSLTHEYLLDELIRSFAVVLKTRPNARLVMIGDGLERAALEAYATDLGITDNIRFTGRLHPEAIAEELRKAHVYVSLIRTEGISSSLIEALSVGVTPVVADISASRQLVEHERNGFLLPECGPVKIAETMIRAAYADQVGETIHQETGDIRGEYDRKKNARLFIERYKTLE